MAVVVSGGLIIDLLQKPALGYGFTSCRTATQLGPRTWTAAPQMCLDLNKQYSAEVQTTKGPFTIQLSPHAAPVTVNNFVVLASQGYYNGLHFFDTQNWEVRSGDPTDSGKGGPGYSLPAEPMANGEKWLAGSVGMALLPNGEMSGGQFFVTRTAWPGGDPSISYNHFGMIQSGFDNLSQLSSGDRILSIQITQT